MNWVHPKWLYALALVPILYFYLSFDQKNRLQKLAKFAQPGVWKRIMPEFNPAASLIKGKFWLAGFFFLILSLARPQFGTHEETVQVTGLDIVVALDISNSMEVEDVVPSRLKKAKHVVRSLMDRMQGDRVGVVAFAASTFLACPLTTDLDYVAETVDGLSPKTISNQGTDLGLALETSLSALSRGAEEAARKDPNNPTSRAVVLITDGEDQEGGAVAAATKIRDSGAKLYILGVGTAKGGPIPMRDESGQLRGYKKDGSGQPVMSQFSSDTLVSLAAASGGKYWDVTPDERELEELLKDVGALNRSDYAERRYVVFEDRYQISLALALLFFLVELSTAARRKVAIMLLVSLSALTSKSTLAGVPLEAYLKNEDGLKAFNQGEFEQAQKSFGEAQALDPSIAELQYNQGVVQLQKGEVEGAIESFKSAAKSMIQKGDIKNGAKSLFNLGNAFQKKGDSKEAIQSYLDSIHASKAAGDQELENLARKNIELIQQQEQQQQQKQNQDQDKQDQNQPQPKQEQKENGQDPNQNPDHKKDDKKDSQNPKDQKEKKEQGEAERPKQKPQFKSQKLSKEDADRVMSELSNREKDLQQKLRKQSGKPKPSSRDW